MPDDTIDPLLVHARKIEFPAEVKSGSDDLGDTGKEGDQIPPTPVPPAPAKRRRDDLLAILHQRLTR